jgi:hypothetical protein
VQLAAAAYASDNQPTTGFTASDNDTTLSGYLDKPLKGSYAFDTTGGLTGTPTYPALTWDGNAKQFVATP